ncbi:hypothetical protein M1116_01745 [Patescibacteria group bacterium]|nr:hypothetical protein [Patescibacteria group bacterium]
MIVKSRREPPYALLFAILLSLTIVIFLLYQKYEREYSTALVLENTTALPTSPPDPTLPLPSPSLTPAPTFALPTPTSLPTPTPATRVYRNDDDHFTVTYKSSRQLYEEKVGTDKRHVFYNSLGNITVHVGSGWSWTYPNREFSDSYLVSGQPAFVYNISTQKLVDFQKGDLDYTVQCVHNGRQALIAECDQFLKDFKFLP